jgi:hypothetical protein
MPEGQQDHRGVAVTVAVALGGLNQSFDFGRSEVFAGLLSSPSVDFREMLPWHDSPGPNPLLC